VIKGAKVVEINAKEDLGSGKNIVPFKYRIPFIVSFIEIYDYVIKAVCFLVLFAANDVNSKLSKWR